MRLRALLLLLPALAAAGCGSSTDKKTTSSTPAATGTAANGPLDVKLDEWKVAPAATTVAAGKVKIAAANDGRATHEMIVLRTDKTAASLGSGKRVSEAGSVGEIADLKAGASAAKTFDLKPGHYVVICNLPGHYSAGMHADLTVR
jgi:uncharacterized cupredoxin-like copper-binding protein